MNAALRPSLFGRELRRLHCAGVGGMGVGPLAIYLAALGFEVSGEDDALTEAMRVQLERAGVRLGPLPDDCECLIHSSAIAPTHPTYAAATARGLLRVRRGELLAEVARVRKLVAVCGAHGKTTTTAMLISALRRAGFPAGYVLGGLFNDANLAPAAAGTNEWVVAEVDESDGTIDRFAPELTVVTNLDWDHPDYYRQLSDLEATFAALFRRTRGAVLTNATCALSARAAQALPTAVTFGPNGQFAFAVQRKVGLSQQLALSGHFAVSTAEVRAAGAFNAANAAAALAAAQLMGATLMPTLLADYPGVRRRQGVLLESPALTVIEDYAHHPSEIGALLESLRRDDGGRLLVAFQPHRYSRTAQFKNDFATALARADGVYLLDVYAAGEAPIAGGTTADVFAALRALQPEAGACHHLGNEAELFRALDRDVRPGDFVAFVGAGDIDQMARAWLAQRVTPPSAPTRWEKFSAAFAAQLSRDTKLVCEEPLAAKTTMRVGGAARVYAEPASAEDLRILLRGAREHALPVYLLGRGSNLIVPDEGVDGLVVALTHSAWSAFELRTDGSVWVGAGLRLKNLCGLATKAGLQGFEFLEGIPGTVGGALRMNAGAMGGWMFQVVEEVQIMDFAGDVRTWRREELAVDYRHCATLDTGIALGARLRPSTVADSEAISRQIETYRRKRHESQPREPSAGCVFRNPAEGSAGRLIDECGLKGARVGDAEVSPVHANFIVNRGAATAGDVLALVRRVRAEVRQRKGVELLPEVLLFGKNWKDVL
ncbi:MAG: UDP-N-acetylmuramate dehydrogenase [Opitutae bacterium]|nr:UDP-N-acetylmuramate dehydrogenase [Opitutae bacterium]